MQSNAGFLGLHNVVGLILLVFATLLLIAIIYVGAKMVKTKEISDKAKRAELRRQVEARKANGS